MPYTCCPQFPPDSGGVVCGGSADYRNDSDLYPGFVFVLPLDETGDGTEDEYDDRTRFDLDGTGGGGESTLTPEIDDGVFCLPSQHFAGREFIELEGDSLNTDESFSVSLWTRVENFYEPRVFYSRGNFFFGFDFLNRLNSMIEMSLTGESTVERFCTGSTALTQGTWYHVACVWHRGEGLKVYLNGVQSGTGDISETITAPRGDCYLSRFGEAGSSSITGNLQEVRLHRRARGAAWFLAEYENLCDFEQFVTIGEEENSSYH